MWPGGVAKVFPPGSRPGVDQARCLPTATAFLRWQVGEEGLHGSFQAYENCCPLFRSHINHMPRIESDRIVFAAARIGQRVHAAGSKVPTDYMLEEIKDGVNVIRTGSVNRAGDYVFKQDW